MIEDAELRALFSAEAEERLNHLQVGMQQLESTPNQKALLEELFRDAHTLKGSARMLSILPIEKLSHGLEEVLGFLKKGEIILSNSLMTLLYEILDAIRLLINEAVTGKKASVRVDDLLGKLKIDAIKQGKIKAEKAGIGEPITEQIASQAVIPSSVRVPTILVNDLMNRAVDLAINKNQQKNLLENIESLQGYWDTKVGVSLTGTPSVALKSVGERITALYEEGYEGIHKLETVVTPLVDLIRKLALVPLSRLFDLFPPMVRELSHASGKEVELILSGGENSIDKNVLEEIKDPLMHILRNAIDHGIESPEERLAASKSTKGSLKISAKQFSSEIILEIEDDGRGFDVELIKQTALKKGLKSEKELAGMDLKEIYALILAPGFSTKQKVTDLSGRGVGMDVVNTSIKKLRGSLEMRTVKGQGSKFIIRLPIALLTTQVLIVQAGLSCYAFPIDSILRCEILNPSQISRHNSHWRVKSAEESYDVDFLSEILGGEKGELMEGKTYSSIVFQAGDRVYGVLVDAIMNQEELVIESPSPYLKGLDHILGSALLPNGKIIVVLALDTII